MKKIIFIIFIFLIISCSTKTQYYFDIDLRSFIEDQNLSNSFIIPSSAIDANIFMFPGFQLDLTNMGPGEEMIGGIILSIPSQEVNNSETSTLHLSMGIEITNISSGSEIINGNKISIYIAPIEIENIYTNGIEIKLLDITDILPGDSAIFEQDFKLEEILQIKDILRTGKLRFGMGIYLSASEDSTSAEYRLDWLNLSFSFSLRDVLVEL